VLHELAVRLGQPPHRFPSDPRAVYDELRAASRGGKADYSGITWERLDAGQALHWPCPATRGGPPHPGTPRMFLDGFAHPDGRARFQEVDHREPAETTGERHPLWATTGRLAGHYQSGSQTRRVPELLRAAPEAVVEIHPDTAARAGVGEGDLAWVSSARGRTAARVRLVPTLRTDTVFLPFHYADDGRANLLTGAALDPRSRMPEFKVSAVRVTPAAPEEDGQP
ncbi:molybdopterin oxidoreductase family protein, partial [Streptomyces capparidis]